MSTFEFNLPVFCSPTQLNFVIGKRDLYESKPIQIFNPYDHLLRFKFFSNAPDRWRVENAQGGIRANNYVTTTVQLREPNAIKQPTSDCLRIEIYKDNELNAVGSKDILLNVLTAEASVVDGTTNFVAFSDTDPAVAQRTQLRTNPIQNLMHGGGQRVSPWQSSSFYWLALVGLFACLLCLLLPTTAPPATDEQSANIFMPNWLRPSHTQHCVASYVLGLLTMYFFLQMN
ncbi:Motile sperm domain-containing protein 1 [Globodera pallida]|nr:Motile sperm domain-containing protein 1 [Globodera pallida]